MSQEEIGNLNRSITYKEIGTVIKSLSKNRSLGQNCSTKQSKMN